MMGMICPVQYSLFISNRKTQSPLTSLKCMHKIVSIVRQKNKCMKKNQKLEVNTRTSQIKLSQLTMKTHSKTVPCIDNS